MTIHRKLSHTGAWLRRHLGLVVLVLLLLLGGGGWFGYRHLRNSKSQATFDAAQRAIDQHQWNDARKLLDECLRHWPDKPAPHLLAARAARRLDLLNLAEHHLDNCERLQGGPSQATTVERKLLQLHNGDLAGTEDWLRDTAAQDDPDAAEILDNLATSLANDHRVPEAHQCLEEALKRSPNHYELLTRHAWTAGTQGWYSVAVDSLRKALQLRPDAHDARLLLARSLVTVGNYNEAMEHLTILRDREPNDANVQFTIARCLAWQGKKEQAAKLLDDLIAQDSSRWAMLSERGWLALELDRPAEAEKFLRRALDTAPPDQTLLTRLADCLRQLGKQEESRQRRDEAERLRADAVRGLQLAKRIREEKPVTPDWCHELACVYLRQRQDKDALHFFKKALELNARHRPTHETLADYFTRRGDPQRAAYHRQQLERNP